jgi:Domain of unknown function (DUF4129)
MAGVQPQPTRRVGVPVVAVLALTTYAVAVLVDPDVEIPTAAVVVSIALVAVLVLTVATGLEFHEQHRLPGGTLLSRLIPLVIAIPVALVVLAAPDAGQDPRQPAPTATPTPGQQPTEGGPGQLEPRPDADLDPNGVLQYALLIGISVAVVALVGWLLWPQWRRWRRRDRTVAAVPGAKGAVAEGSDVDEEQLAEQRRIVREGLRHGRSALVAGEDPRHAVIRAYVAFESHVGERGMVREPAETQREYVARVLAEGRLAHSERAPQLVELFNAARFSSLPVTPGDAQAARDHIGALVGD